MVKGKLYISIIILLVSSIIGIDLLSMNEVKPRPVVAYAGDSVDDNLVMDDFIMDIPTTTTTTTTVTTTTNITTTVPITTTTKRVINNYLSVSGYNRQFELIKSPDTKYEDITKGNKYAVIDNRLDFNSRKIIIYGHSYVGGGGLFNYFQNYDNNKPFYNNHKYITINYNNNIYKYEIFSVYIVTANSDDDPSMEYYYWYNYSNVKWNEVIKSYKSKSQYDTGVDVSVKDKILIIQTCSTNPSVAGKYYKANLLIMAKLINE